ncbi:MAG TPA: heme exporter protein CcmD [Bauldia sp.]|nr:heme exporter protein CcmD [Bauldia sp.]
MESLPHGDFIFAAYCVTVLVIAGVILWVVLDGRWQRRRLAELDAQGIRRRSAGKSS